MTNHPVFRAVYRAAAGIALGLTLIGCCCPVSDIKLERHCAKPDPQVVKETAEPIAIAWQAADKASSAFNSRNDVLELAFDSFQAKAIPPAVPPVPTSGAPPVDGKMVVTVPEGNQSEVFFVQIRGNLQRPKTGSVGLTVSMGKTTASFNIFAGKVQATGGSISYWIATPFDAANGDTKAVSFALSFETKMPGVGRSQPVPVAMNLSAVNGAGETAEIAVTSMTVSARPKK